MSAYQDGRSEFENAGAQILGISVDSFASNAKFAEEIGAEFPLLSDFHREVSRAYGVLDEKGGYAQRTTFVIDKDGVVRAVIEGNDAIDPAPALEAVKALD